MNNSPNRHSLLLALSARLRLDEGMGVGYAIGSSLGKLTETTVQPLVTAKPLRRPVPEMDKSTNSGSEDRSSISTRRSDPPPRPAFRARSAETRNLSTGVTLVPLLPARPCPEREARLEPLRRQAMTCEACRLCEKRNSVVWGEGALDAEVMFIGEGPGRDEDEQGRPFVGRSGKLLSDIIEKGMKVQRREVYIANVVKCRPPGNRDPRPDEIEACNAYLAPQIETIAPKVIVAVGGVAGCALLGLPPRSGGLRGRWHEFRGIPLRVIYHPSYLLRQRNSHDDRTSADRDTWLDIQEVMRRLG